MAVTLQNTEYITTKEAAVLLGITTQTWRKIAAEAGLTWTTQIGKRGTYLWKKREAEQLLKPIPTDGTSEDCAEP